MILLLIVYNYDTIKFVSESGPWHMATDIGAIRNRFRYIDSDSLYKAIALTERTVHCRLLMPVIVIVSPVYSD